jgi:ribosomal protein S6--L-glutamate ligase
VIEINASPGFVGLERAPGVDVAGAIVRYAVELAQARRAASRVHA